MTERPTEPYYEQYGVDLAMSAGGPIKGPVYDVWLSTKAPRKPYVATLHLADGSNWHSVELRHEDLLALRKQIDRLLDDGTDWPGVAAERPEWWTPPKKDPKTYPRLEDR